MSLAHKTSKGPRMIKLITSDIDETLVDDAKNVPMRNRTAIDQAQDKGLIVMLATGRGPYELRDIPEQAGVVHDDRFIICCNGAIILDAKSREIVKSLPMEYEYAAAVFRYAKENKLQCFIYTLEKKYAINLDEYEKSAELKNDSSVKIISGNNLEFLKDKIVLKAIIKHTNLDFLHSIEPDIAELCKYDVEISYSSDMYMEINAKGVDKAKALKKVADHYGIDMAHTMTIGDNYNDIAMLEAAGTSVAVANAHLQVKEVAGHVTKATNNEGAVAEAIERFVLNK